MAQRHRRKGRGVSATTVVRSLERMRDASAKSNDFNRYKAMNDAIDVVRHELDTPDSPPLVVHPVTDGKHKARIGRLDDAEK